MRRTGSVLLGKAAPVGRRFWGFAWLLSYGGPGGNRRCCQDASRAARRAKRERTLMIL
jgi:hypothetical protein